MASFGDLGSFIGEPSALTGLNFGDAISFWNICARFSASAKRSASAICGSMSVLKYPADLTMGAGSGFREKANKPMQLRHLVQCDNSGAFTALVSDSS